MKITVLLDKGEKVVAAHVPVSTKSVSYEVQPMSRLVPSDGEEVRELDIPDDEAMAEGGPGTDFLEKVQRLVSTKA